MKARLDWISHRDAFDAMVAEAGRSNLLQSWAWGEAKAEAEGWRPRRAVIAYGTNALACVQVLEKRKGPLRVARINRGPLWLADDLTAAARTEAYGALRRQWRWWNGGILLIAPELAAGEAALLQGFRPRSAPCWRSAWVELFSRDIETIRKSLNGKWRNMLVNAEKAGLAVEVMTGAAGIDWLLPRYRELMQAKGFAGISPALLTALARHADSDDLLTLVARAGGEPASAVLVARHGLAATYLVGWNDEAGRKTRANHLLLWRALSECKDRGVRWFDVGGIDDVLTPGVASFKRGLGGEEYVQVGEWLSV
ncbi:MAG TPA: GNAT family N-acetyltransferase [Candidatus Omnitrophota bacterium]|nr:GNAT family N-acetyltransferase [Candidatus Omnitrophota bacterium]